MDLKNDSGLAFKSLTDEEYRVYVFDDSFEVRITEPQALNVSKSGGHRVLDAAGVSHYIPRGWRHLYWKVKAGQPHFAF